MKRLFLLLTLLAACMAHAENLAIVVGVGGYPNLAAKWHLEGPLVDMEEMGRVLKAYGFQRVVSLKDSAATRERIVAELKDAAAKQKSTDAFTFYFAGHGCKEPEPLLMPYDSTTNPADKGITSEELNKLVKAVPASSRTVILDSCYSGSMIVTKGIDGIKTRAYEPDEGVIVKAAHPRPPQGDPLVSKPGAANGVCYVTAASPVQQALEMKIGNDNRGLFTYYLSQKLDGQKKPWDNVVSDVSMDIKNKLSNVNYQQSPEVSPAFRPKPVFASAEAEGVPPQPPADMARLYAADRPNPDLLSLSISTNNVDMKIGQAFSIKAKLAQPGYLVVLQAPGGKLQRMYPDSDDVALVQGEVVLPEIYGDEACQETVRAFVFRSKAAALAVVKAIPTDFIPTSGLLEKGLKTVGGSNEFVTATLTLQVLPLLNAPLEIVDPNACWSRLQEDSAQSKQAMECIRRRANDDERVKSFSSKKNQTAVSLMMCMNLLLESNDLHALEGGNAAAPSDRQQLIAQNAQILLKFFTIGLRKRA